MIDGPATLDAGLPEPLLIQYEGLDAERHEIEIAELAASLKGIGRIVGVVATFATTQKLDQHQDTRPLKGPPKAGSVTFEAILQWVDQHQTISGIASGLIVTLVGYVVSRAAGKREEMKHLKDLAETAIRQLGNRDEAVIARLLDTVDKMADTLKPAIRQAVRETLRLNIPMRIRLEIKQRWVDGEWKVTRRGRSVVEVLSPTVE